jgi:hypothetical protein
MRMQNPFLRLFPKDALKQSIDLLEQIRRHEEKSKPLAEARYQELDQAALEVAARLVVAERAGSPKAEPLEIELRAIQHQRESAMFLYTQERDRLFRELEKITRPLIDRFLRECQLKRPQISGLMAAEVKEKIYDSVSDRWQTMVSNNYHIVAKALELLEEARKRVDGMRHSSLDLIQAAIVEFETAFEQLNFDERQLTEVAESRIEDFLPSTALSASGKMDTAWMGPSTSPHSTSGGWQLNFIGGRE